jgi:uncharacterized protein YegL
MAKPNLTELVFILDRSGSMGGLESDTIGGFNSTLKQQQKIAGDAIVTTVLFDNKYELLHDRINIHAVKPVTNKDYYVRGCTALLDAVGLTINKINTAQNNTKNDFRPRKTLFVIITDGLENASQEFTAPQIEKMIKSEQEKGWEFIFLGANIDAIKTAQSIGIRKDMATDFLADEKGVAASYCSVSEAAYMLREDSHINRGWKKRAKSDYEKRKGTNSPK